MNRPKDIPQWAWEDAQDLWFEQLNFANDRMGAMPIVARALLKARGEAFEEVLQMAKLWPAKGPTIAACEIADREIHEFASAIRQHSQKGEK